MIVRRARRIGKDAKAACWSGEFCRSFPGSFGGRDDIRLEVTGQDDVRCGASRRSKVTTCRRLAGSFLTFCAPRSIAKWCTACRRKNAILKKGDIVSIDTGVQLDGYFGDSAVTIAVGEIDGPVISCSK